jgi:hypothetical protein
MAKFTDAFKRKMAAREDQQKISEKIFFNSTIKDTDGNAVGMPGPDEKYLLYSKQTGKKIGWIKTPGAPGEAGYGWCNLPAYLKMEEPPEIPDEFENEGWDEVDLNEYFDPEEMDRFQMYLDMEETSSEPNSTMTDGEMIDSYMDMQARLDELQGQKNDLTYNRNLEGLRKNKESVDRIMRDMEE